MTDERKGGIALIAAEIALLLTMAVHPTGHDLLTADQFNRTALINSVAHWLGIISMPLFFLGALALTWRLQSADRFAISALVIYGLSLVAGLGAAVASGFVAPHIAKGMLTATGQMKDTLNFLFHYTGQWNQAFAKVLTVGSSVSIIFWSAAILRNALWTKWIAYYGMLAGAAIVVLVAAGILGLGVHGFAIVVALQGAWFISAGTLLMRTEAPE